jgi:ribosome-binding factor A
MIGSRKDRVASSIHHELTRIMQTEMHDPRLGFATVTGVKVTPDLHRARVYVSILGSEEEQEAGLAALNGARGFLRRELSHTLRLRRIPDLEIRLDRSGERGDRIERLLREQRPREEPGPWSPPAAAPENDEATASGDEIAGDGEGES